MMLSFCAAFIQAMLLSAPTETAATNAQETYAEAHRQTTETGTPLVVMVSSDWCGPCQTMKRNILPKLRERGLFKRVAFAQVNADKESRLAKELTGGGPVPQLVMYRRTNNGWLRRKLIGAQSLETVEQFIKEGLALDQAQRKDETVILDEDAQPSAPATAELPEESAKSPDLQAG